MITTPRVRMHRGVYSFDCVSAAVYLFMVIWINVDVIRMQIAGNKAAAFIEAKMQRRKMRNRFFSNHPFIL